MDELQGIALVGLSHRSAPVALREQVAVQPELLPALLKDLVGQPAVAEACVLSTCNRTEAVLVAAEGEDPVPAARRRIFDGVAAEAPGTKRRRNRYRKPKEPTAGYRICQVSKPGHDYE